MAKKESQDGKSKKGLPRLMELAIYFIIQEIVGAYPDFSTLDVQSAGIWRPCSRWGSPECTALHCIRGAVAHCGLWDSVSMQNQLCFPHYKAPTGLPLKMGSGKLRKVMDDNIESLEGFIAHDLPNMISAFVAPVVMLVLVFIVDWRFGLATFVGIIVSFLMYGVTSGGNKTKKLMEDYQTSLEDMSNASVEYI